MPNLEAYRRKRDFSRTPEPAPSLAEPGAEQRNLVFVVQQHAAYRAGMHWDFRLEAEGVLKSWPLRKPPSLDPRVKRGAVMTEDHPYDYRTFEGVIPRGEYGGGQVIVWDEGIFTPDEDGVTSWNDKEEGSRRVLEGIAAGKLSFTLQGHKLRGSFALVKTRYRPDSWLMIKHRDEFASEQEIDDERSVRSGLTVQDLREGRLPNAATASLQSLAGAREASAPDSRKTSPMLATLVERAFDAPGWLWEPKLDGIRTLAFVEDGKAELRSRRGVDVTRQYPGLVAALEGQPSRNFVLDGEVCALDEQGVPRFQLLQPRINLVRGVDPAQVDEDIPVVFFAFDLLYLDGYDLKGVPLSERKRLLETRLIQQGPLRVVSYVPEHGPDVAEGAKALGFEGVVGKRADSRYEPGQRSRAWLKIKTVQQQEFVIGGFTPGEGARRSSFGALAIGYYDDDSSLSSTAEGQGERAPKLHYAGNVGSGFNDQQLAALRTKLDELATAESPFTGPIDARLSWVRPELVAEVKFAEWTKDGRLRAPVFLGLRDDVDPRQVRREQPAAIQGAEQGVPSTEYRVQADGAEIRAVESGALREEVSDLAPAVSLHRGVDSLLEQLARSKPNGAIEVEGERIKLTNLDKEFWPAYDERPSRTKRDLIRYYVSVAPYLLPHLKDRPLTLTRYPNGIGGQLFYQKHYEQPIPGFVETLRLWSETNRGAGDYIMCNNLPTLVWLAQIADLELHAWMSRVEPEPDAHGRPLTFSQSEAALAASVLNFPDYMIFDLDPYIYAGHEARGAEPEYNRRAWQKTVEIALSLKDLLDQLKLSSFVKTTGKTGIHVYVPILRHFDYDDLRAANQTLGRFLMQQHPRDLTMEWDTSKRTGKVFFDANQNTRGKTLAAQYSLRPTPWAGVSTPVTWSELPDIDPTALNIDTVPGRLAERGDPWADILNRKNDLRPLLSSLS